MRGAVAIFSLGILLASVSSTAQAVVVTPGDLNGWQLTASDGNVNLPAPSVQFENGPATPPAGTGSLEFRISPAGSDAAQARLTTFAGTPLTGLQTLGYSSFVEQNNGGNSGSLGNGGQAPYIILSLDYNNNGVSDDSLFFEPIYQTASFFPSNPQPAVALNTWQNWDARNGGWWSLNNTAGAGPGANVKPLSAIIGAQPNATIVNSTTGLGGVRLVTGFGGPLDWGNFIGNADLVTIGTSAGTTSYDFELTPIPEPAAVVFGCLVCLMAGMTFAGKWILKKPAKDNAG